MNRLIKDRIQKQLLNFDQQDIEFDKSNSTQESIDKLIDREKWILENIIDLGLPSGTLWMKNNLGATCGNTPESWYGDYYAWGEMETKNNYTANSYTYYDTPDILLFDYDIVFQKTNGIYHIPTEEQLEELINETKNKWIENYNNIKGLNGMVFTGSNGNTLFIPSAGYYYRSIVYYQGTYCCLWSISIDQSDTDYAYDLDFDSSGICVKHISQCFGQSVRGVL